MITRHYFIKLEIHPMFLEKCIEKGTAPVVICTVPYKSFFPDPEKVLNDTYKEILQARSYYSQGNLIVTNFNRV